MRKNCSKVVLEKFFEPCVLYLLLRKKTYGYDLQKQLEQECGCPVNIGNLYRSLAQLSVEGAIKKSGDAASLGPKRVNYAITAQGKKLLKIWISELAEQKKAMEKLIKNYKKITHVTS